MGGQYTWRGNALLGGGILSTMGKRPDNRSALRWWVQLLGGWVFGGRDLWGEA